MFPTPFSDLNKVLVELVSRMRNILADDFIGFYLQGSLAIGDFDEHSDVDWIVAARGELTSEQVDSLQEMHLQVFNMGPEWAKHLEGSYFPRDILKKPVTRSAKLWYLDNGADHLIRSDHCNTILVRWIVREKGVVLYGPSPESLVNPISSEMLRREIRNEILMWGQHILDDPTRYSNHFYQTFIVLNFARMMHDLIRGYPGSKREGARWAKSNLDPSWQDLIACTWDGRPDPASKIRQPAESEAYRRTLEFVRLIMDRAESFEQ